MAFLSEEQSGPICAGLDSVIKLHAGDIEADDVSDANGCLGITSWKQVLEVNVGSFGFGSKFRMSMLVGLAWEANVGGQCWQDRFCNQVLEVNVGRPSLESKCWRSMFAALALQ